MGYWETRQEEMYKAGEMKVNQYFEKLEKAFNQTKRELQKAVEGFYFRYAEENGLTYAAAQKQLDRAEIGELKDFIELSMENIGKYSQEVNNLSIKARMTRYQALEAQVDAMLRQLYAIDFRAQAEQTMNDVYWDTYNRTWYNIDQYHGFHSNFTQVNERAVDKLLEYPFNGASFSSRLWKQKDHLQTQLMESITTILIQGVPPQKLAADFSKKMQSKKFEAYRLLHTESSFLMGEATHEGYMEDGVEKYQILATLDSKTCDICGDLDGKIYLVSEAVVGKNMQPFHCLCRCTDVPYYEDTPTEDLTRVARDPETGEVYEVPADMTYQEWKKLLDSNSFENDFTDKIQNLRNTLNDHNPIEIFNMKNNEDIIGIIDHAPKVAREYTKAHLSDIKIINEKYGGIAKTSKNGIRFNIDKQKNDIRGSYTSFFHEVGHLLDLTNGNPSLKTEFNIALQTDFKSIVTAYQKYYNVNINVAYEEIGKSMQGDSFHSVSDLYSALSGGKCAGKWKHDQHYWESDLTKLPREAFAHFYEATIRNDIVKIGVLQSMFPSAYAMFEDMLR